MTKRHLLLALAALVTLTLGSWGLAHLHLGYAAVPVALGIAVIKAGIVAVIFMEVPHASRPAHIAALVTIFFIALLAAGTAADVETRDMPGHHLQDTMPSGL